MMLAESKMFLFATAYRQAVGPKEKLLVIGSHFHTYRGRNVELNSYFYLFRKLKLFPPIPTIPKIFMKQ
jgi:hypothetical protein